MRNLKKLLAVIVAICVLATFTVPAFAAETTKTDAEICEDLGVLKGNTATDGVTDEYLADGTTRIQAAILCLRLLGLEDEAKAETSEENFEDAAAMTWTEGKTILAYLKKNPELGWVGDNINFGAQNPATAQMLYKAILTALGYKQGVDFEYANAIAFAGEKGLTAIASVTELTNNDVAKALVESLKAKVADGSKTLVEKLIADGTITAAAAEAAGLIATAVPLDVSSAVALNSKVVEVTLGTAATANDLTGVTVKDSTAKDIAVSKIEFAPWATNGKTVLVTLAADTAVGTYYTLTAGTKSVNFGGKAADTGKPTVSKVESTDYNEIKVTFSEPVLLGGTVSAALKYTPKTALATTTIAYASSTSITVATDAQAASLYGTTINGFVDLAGNAMAEDTGKTFIGTTKSTTVPAIADIAPIDSLSVKVVFNEKMDDVTSVDLSKYTAALKYTPKTALAIASVAKDADDATGKTVILTFAADTTTSLYEVTVAAGVVSKYGVASTASSAKTFIGVAKDETKLGTPTITNVSNTQIKLDFGNDVADKVDPATTKDMFSIKLKYSPYTELEISSISISKEVVTITTAAQATSLYEIVIKSGIKDAKGNATTADIKTTFVGQAVAPKITAINAIVNGDSGTTLTLTFNENVGAGAYDVANYFINGGIGYPAKAEAVTDQPAQVKLTIPATTLGTKYTITVKNVSNADGVAMDAAGITKTFIGAGAAAGLAQMIAIQTLDEQTIKVYFDRDVTDAKIKGVIWDSAAKNIKNSTLEIDVAAAGNFALTTANTYAYQDLNDKTALVIRVNSAAIFNATNKDTTVGAFKLNALPGAGLHADHDELVFVPSETNLAGIGIVNVQAIDNQTVKVFFDQPTYIEASGENFATIESTLVAGGAAPTINILQAVAVAGTNNMEYLLKLSAAMASTSKDFTLKVSDSAANLILKINDTSTGPNFVTLVDEDGTTGDPIAISRLFAPVFTAPADITDIWIQMTDAKTLVVHYPQAMNTSTTGTGGGVSASVLDFDNYAIKNGASPVAAVTMSDDAAFDPTDIGNITWDAANNTATIVLNKTIKTATGGAFLYFQNDATKIANVTGLAFVKDGTAQVYKQFAVSSAAAAEVGIKSVTVAGTLVTIVLDQKSFIHSDVTTTGSGLLTHFSITKSVGGTDVAITSADITDIAVATNDTITVTLSAAIPANTGVTVKGILTDKAKIYGLYNAEGLNDAAEVVVAAQ